MMTTENSLLVISINCKRLLLCTVFIVATVKGGYVDIKENPLGVVASDIRIYPFIHPLCTVPPLFIPLTTTKCLVASKFESFHHHIAYFCVDGRMQIPHSLVFEAAIPVIRKVKLGPDGYHGFHDTLDLLYCSFKFFNFL